MRTFKETAKKWRKKESYRKAYDALADEYAIAAALISARSKAKLTQQELAKKMKTTQPVIARMESGKHLPSAASLLKFAKATGTKLQISFIEA